MGVRWSVSPQRVSDKNVQISGNNLRKMDHLLYAAFMTLIMLSWSTVLSHAVPLLNAELDIVKGEKDALALKGIGWQSSSDLRLDRDINEDLNTAAAIIFRPLFVYRKYSVMKKRGSRV